MPSKVYQLPETAIFWGDTGSTPDELLTCTNLAAGAGHQGALHDFGTAAHAREHSWRAYYIPATTPVVGEVVDIYWKTSDGSHPDNDDGVGDIAVSAEDKLRGLTQIGTIEVDEIAIVEFVGKGFMDVVHRHGAPVFWNRTADAFSATAANHGFILTPMPIQGQDT